MRSLEMPVIYFLPTHLTPDELHQWEAKTSALSQVTKVASEANFIVGKISQKPRAQFELRRLRLPAEEATQSVDEPPASPRVKRQKISTTQDLELGSKSATGFDGEQIQDQEKPIEPSVEPEERTRKVVRLAWLQDSFSKGQLLDYREYLVYAALKSPVARVIEPQKVVKPSMSQDLPQRSREVAAISQDSTSSSPPYRRHRDVNHHIRKAPPLLPHSTTEENAIANFPPIPECLHTTYSCQRSTFDHPPNEAFIRKLKELRELRSMTGDQIGVRAYSSAIASLSAYPYRLQSPAEVRRLPGCGDKFSFLFTEFENFGQLAEIQKAASNEKLMVIKTFYNIFGVSAVTAEDFYQRGWRDLDDIIEYGWKTISRSQQIGVKYYDELLQKIPRSETESIAETVFQHALRIQEGFQIIIVGGYRRGKVMSGDVDLILSHPDEEATHKFISKLVISLEQENFITHTLSLSTHNSERGQRPTSFKPLGSGGTGFDTLDKALVVWQDHSSEPTATASSNPKPHRRVDIIISPWKTVGCAVLGWTSETTFQRDLRQYCKHERNLKFDSSGIRSRKQPFDWVDLEDGGKGKARTMEEAEKRVFEGLELEWRPPEERCTG